ncbi:MAG: hypothetical protein J6M05_04530 [Cardiobacteriaceae bacterium]|nr:hypothetical protein [Cardiobacteriaceae bacterium]
MKKKIQDALKSPLLLSTAICLGISSITFSAFAQYQHHSLDDPDGTGSTTNIPSSSSSSGDSDDGGSSTSSDDSDSTYDSYTASPFAPVPAYLDSEVTKTSGWSKSETIVNKLEVGEKITETVIETRIGGSGRVLPRITLLFDNSGSMSKENDSGKTRMQRLQDAMNATIGSDKYAYGAYYNVIPYWWLNAGTFRNYNINDQVLHPQYTNGKVINSYVQSFAPYGMTPATAVYVSAVDHAYNAIQYSCQKNYIIFLSDGDTNEDVGQEPDKTELRGKGILKNHHNVSATSYRAKHSPLADIYELNSEFRKNRAGWLSDYYLYYAATYVDGVPSSEGGDDGWKNKDWWYFSTNSRVQTCFSSRLAELFAENPSNPETMGRGWCLSIGSKRGTGEPLKIEGAINSNASKDTRPAGSVMNGAEYFSDKVYKNTLKTGNDIEGRPYGTGASRQHIQTIAIALGDDLSDNGRAYLRRAVRIDPDLQDKLKGAKFGPGYVDVSDSDDLTAAFDNLFSAITVIGTSSTTKEVEYSDDKKTDTDKTETSTSESSTTETGGLVTTALASPVSIATSSLDVSKYPSDVGNNYGLMSILNINTSNWSSALKFYRIYRTSVKQGDFCDKMNDGGYLCNEADYEKGETPANLANFPKNRQVLAKHPVAANNYEVFDLNSAKKYVLLPKKFGFSKLKYKDEFANGFWPWLLRDASQTDKQIAENIEKLNLDEQIVSQYRDRLANGEPEYERQMGDVLDAGALAIPNTDGRELEEDKTDNAKYLLMGANDGMLYAFERNTTTVSPYDLKFNYLPYRMPREEGETLGEALSQIADVSYGTAIQHMYGVNGGFALLTTASALNDKNEAVRNRETLVIGNMGQGGRGAYALLANGNDPTSAAENAPVGFEKSIKDGGLWEVYNGKGDSKMGYTISKPSAYPIAKDWKLDEKGERQVVDPLGDIRVAAFIANGFPTGAKDASASERHNHDGKPTLYIYDALGVNFSLKKPQAFKNGHGGTLIKKIEAPAEEHANGINALAAPVVVDVDFDGIADVAYAGDYNGDLYRFDLRGAPSKWSAVKIFNGEATQPITAAPAVYRIPQKLLEEGKIAGDKYVVVFGTGSDIYHKDRESAGERQAMYGIYDDLTDEKPEAAGVNQLIEQKLEVEGESRYIRKRADGLDEYPNLVGKYKGWKVLLDEGHDNGDGTGVTSERVVVQPDVLFEGVFFTTRAYSIESSAIGISFLTPNMTSQSDTLEGNDDFEEVSKNEGDWVVISSSPVLNHGTADAGETCGTHDTTEQRKIVTVYERKKKSTSTTTGESHSGSKFTEKESTKGYSWFMGLNVLTGGKLNSDSITFAKDRRSEDELNAMTEEERKKAIAKEGEFVGDKYDEILSATVIQRASESNKLRDALNQNGGVQGGELTNPGVVGKSALTGKAQNNQCAKGNNGIQDFGIYASGSSSGMIQKGLVVKPCGGSFIRTSLREVKMLER